MPEIHLENRIGKHAEQLMRHYMLHAAEASRTANQWTRRAERQCFRDALHSMVLSGLLADYDLEKHTLTFPDGSTTNLRTGERP